MSQQPAEHTSKADADAVRKEILAAQQAFEEDVKENGLYVSPEVKFRYAVALSQGANKDDFILARCYFNDLWQVGYEVKRSRLEIARLHLKLGDYRKCRQMCQQLMALPSTRQTQGSGNATEGGESNTAGSDGSDEDAKHLAEVEALHQQAVHTIYSEGKKGLFAVTVIAVLLGGLLVWQRQQGLAPKKASTSS